VSRGKEANRTKAAEFRPGQARRRELVVGLKAIADLLEGDLRKITSSQTEAARKALKDEPSHRMLSLALRKWATALAAACRSYAARCAKIHASLGQQDPAVAAMDTILLPLANRLKVPTLFQKWPEENAVRDFALEVSGGTWPLLPRWDRNAKNLDRPRNPLLSKDETSALLRHLEESFRTELFENLFASLSEAQLTTALISSRREPPRGKRGRHPHQEEQWEAAGKSFIRRNPRISFVDFVRKLSSMNSPPAMPKPLPKGWTAAKIGQWDDLLQHPNLMRSFAPRFYRLKRRTAAQDAVPRH